MKARDTEISLILLSSMLTIGLAFGWVAGSMWPWALPALIGMGALALCWLIWNVTQMNRDMGQWADHAETARRLLDEAEADE